MNGVTRLASDAEALHAARGAALGALAESEGPAGYHAARNAHAVLALMLRIPLYGMHRIPDRHVYGAHRAPRRSDSHAR